MHIDEILAIARNPDEIWPRESTRLRQMLRDLRRPDLTPPESTSERLQWIIQQIRSRPGP